MVGAMELWMSCWGEGEFHRGGFVGADSWRRVDERWDFLRQATHLTGSQILYVWKWEAVLTYPYHLKLVSVCDLSLAPNIHYFGPSDNQQQILHLCLNAYVTFWIAH